MKIVVHGVDKNAGTVTSGAWPPLVNTSNSMFYFIVDISLSLADRFDEDLNY